jgi:IS5 family transposase
VLTLFAAGAESLWDELLPGEMRVLPDDLARLDGLLCDPELLVPIALRWERELAEASRYSDRGRPSLAMETYVRLMVLKHRCGWGYETLMREVSDSIHLRRFCRLGSTERAPDESTVRKLTRRLGPEVVHQLTRELIHKARREKRFRPRAARIDSTVVEADIRYPTDSGLAADGVGALAREGRKLAAKIGAKRTAVRDRSRAVGRRLRGITRSMRRRSGQAKEEVLKLTKQTGKLLAKSVKEARRLAAEARRRARGRGAQAKLRAARKFEQLADRCEKVVEQIKKRVKGEKITDRLISLWDPDARPIRKGKLSQPNQFGYVDQLCEITPNQAWRAWVHPPARQRDRQPGRGHATARNRERAGEPRDQAAGGDGRRRVQRRPDQHRAAGPRRRNTHHRPPRTRLPAHPPPPPALPDRRGGTGQPPQTRLRPAPQPAQRRRRPPDLGRLGDLHLQRRHLHHPAVRKQPSTKREPARSPEGSSRKDHHPLHNHVTRAAIPHPSVSAAAFIRGK